MSRSNFTEEEVEEALAEYRLALSDAVSDLGADVTREELISEARDLLADEDQDQHDIIVALAESDLGDPVWSLEEELIDNQEVVPSGDYDDDEDDEDDIDDEEWD